MGMRHAWFFLAMTMSLNGNWLAAADDAAVKKLAAEVRAAFDKGES